MLGQLRRLQTRIVIGIGTVALVLSLGLGLSTYFTVRASLLDERQANAVNQVAASSQLLSAALRSEGVSEAQLLGSLRPQVQSFRLLERNGQWFTASLGIGPEELPYSLVESVLNGSTVRQRFSIGNEVFLAVGTPLLDRNDNYFEVFPLDGLNAELGTLRNTLATTGVAATAMGLALGAWVARRVTRPLSAISSVAQRIADGHLESRLDSTADKDLQMLAHSFNRMADSLQDRLERESRFAADVSHELRSPLTTLLTSVAVLENRRHELSSDGQEALGLLSADVFRLERMVADLIEIAKHDAGTTEVSWSYASVPELTLRVLQRLRVSDIPIYVSEQAENATVRIDERRLERTIANLVENAEVYGGGTARVAVDADAGKVRISIEDQGPGIPSAEHERIFERFARGQASHRRANLNGSGLGLALAVENLSAMNGSIWVENPHDGGARFVIELPRVQP